MSRFAIIVLQVAASVAVVGIGMPALVTYMNPGRGGRLGLFITGTAVGTTFVLMRSLRRIIARKR